MQQNRGSHLASRVFAILFLLLLGLAHTTLASADVAFTNAGSFDLGDAGNLPPAARTNSGGTSTWLHSVSCASAGNCTAVGESPDLSGNSPGLLLSEAGGIWSTGIEAPLPANASASPFAYISSVSCASAGNCTAVGYYKDTSGSIAGLLLSETGGTWSTGIEAPLPANANASQVAYVGAVSCASAGNCTAVGYYEDSSGNFPGLLLSETGGTWFTGIEAPLPANATANQGKEVGVDSVSCASAGHCTAVGSYRDYSGRKQGLLLSETGGTWSTGIEALLPANASVSFEGPYIGSVSCASAGNCVAVGEYVDTSGSIEGLLLSESGGTWSTGEEAPLPANANSAHQQAGLHSVSCTLSGSCAAVGTYQDTSGSQQGVLLSEQLGETWSTFSEAALPANAHSAYPQPYLESVSCASAGSCTAVGRYDDASGNPLGLLLSESGEVWSRGIEAPLPANASASPFTFINSVSCASAGSCTAVGDYLDTSGNQQGLLLSESGGTWSTGIEAPLPVNVYAPVVVTGSATGVSDSAATLSGAVNPNGVNATDCHFAYGLDTTYGSSVPCSQVVGEGTSPVAVSANLSWLTPGTTYHFELVAVNANGTAYGEDRTFTTSGTSGASPSPSGNGPTPPPAATCGDSSKTIGPFTIKAACFLHKGGKFIAKGRVRIDGVDIVPDGSGSITVEPRALRLSSSGEVRVYLGSIEVYHRSLDWNLQGSLTLELPAGVKAKGVPITGKLQLTPSAANGGSMQVGANAMVGPITGSMGLELSNAFGLQMQNATLTWTGGLPLKQLVVKRATLSYEHTSVGDEWSGKVAVELPAKLPELDGKLALLNGKIAEVALAASKINKYIGSVVYLQKIGLDVRVVPHITATGELGLSAGPELPVVDAPAALLEGTLTADFGSPFILSATGKLVVAGKLNLASAKAKWTVPSRFELSGEAKLSVGPASVDAYVSGIVASKGFSLYGNGSVSIPGASGNGIVYFSEKGFGACFMESIGPVTVAEGFGAHWRLEFPSLWFDTCGLLEYKSVVSASSSGQARSSAGGEVVRVPPRQEQVLIGARGTSSFPEIAVQSPGGQLIDPANGVSGPVEGGGYRFVSDPPHLGTYVILAHPRPGAWRIIPMIGSPEIASYGSALGAPPLRVRTRVRTKGGRYELSWRATHVHGETIRFTEVTPTSTRVLETTPRASGSLRFKPTDLYSRGARTIEALVSVDGLPRKVGKVTFKVPHRRLPKIRGLHIQSRKKAALIRWQPVPGVALDLSIQLSDGRRLFFRLPPGSHSQRVQMLPWTKRLTASITTIAVTSGRMGPRSQVSARL